MANVTDSASVLVVPSGWSDGVLGSLQPDDGTGDFTFSRGSDLSATRVNEQGHIEKGYENRLLQSNTFDVSPWFPASLNATSGESGYDGSSDAWKLQAFQDTTSSRLQQDINLGVCTYSVYAKEGNTSSLALRSNDSSTVTFFDLSGTGSFTKGSTAIDASMVSVGNGWFRCSVVFNSVTSVRFYVSDSVGGYSVTAGTYLYIQDAMINQGLVAYPYLETTTTTAKNPVILEDQPRIDYTSGNGAVLIEPQGTNIIFQSEYLEGINWNTSNFLIYDDSVLNPSGYYGSTKTNFSGGTPLNYTSAGGYGAGTKVSMSMFVKSATSNNFMLGGQTSEQATFNALTGVLISQGTDVNSAYSVDYGNGWRRLVVNYTFQNLFNNNILYPRFRWFGNPEYVYLWGYQIQLNVNDASSYIPTYGISQTRLKDTATLTKNVTSTGTVYININAQTSRTLTFLGADISVTEGVNKIAMAYSPTALKVSHNGTIVANITRAFDTTALTQIQLGHRNNFEQTTDSINQFLTLDSFLNDTKLNELTA
jgi:hypothetical protein